RRYFKGGQFRESVSAAGKIAIVTGANTGIGLETAKELNLRGAKVYMLCRTESRAHGAMSDLVKAGCDSARLIYIHCDMTSKKSVRNCSEELAKRESRIDILVNNAGMWAGGYEKTGDGHELSNSRGSRIISAPSSSLKCSFLSLKTQSAAGLSTCPALRISTVLPSTFLASMPRRASHQPMSPTTSPNWRT
ncbi:hypothetical protein PFISCL1PPCAC_12792, partial [Pristionchus fissidentatus]